MRMTELPPDLIEIKKGLLDIIHRDKTPKEILFILPHDELVGKIVTDLINVADLLQKAGLKCLSEGGELEHILDKDETIKARILYIFSAREVTKLLVQLGIEYNKAVCIMPIDFIKPPKKES